MKRTAIFLFLPFVVMSAAVANTELSINYFCTTWHETHVRFSNIDKDITMDHDSFVGIEGNLNVFLGSPTPHLDLGVNMGTGIDFYRQYSVGSVDEKIDVGIDYFFTAGPALRMTLGQRNSFFISPGIQFNYRLMDKETGLNRRVDFEDKYFALNLNVGHRLWVKNGSRRHIGIDTGVNVAYPLVGRGTNSSTEDDLTIYDHNYRIKSGNIVKFYIGFCYNFGKRGIDR